MSAPIKKEIPQNVTFYLHKIVLTPYINSEKQATNDILFDMMTFLNKNHLEDKAFAIDRHHNRPELEKREMFMNNPVRIAKEKRFKCSIALIRDKVLMLKPNDNFKLIPFNKATGSIAELTHFYIDYSVSPAVFCVEFNSNGPRLSDIEFYLRNLASAMNVAKACQATTFMDAKIDDTLEHLHNVLNFEIKLRPQSIAKMDNDIKDYIMEFINLGNKLKPNFIRIEAMFQTPGTKVKSKHLNKEANTMIKALLKKFKTKPFHIEEFEEFEVKFVNSDGEDDKFNLLKGKREIVVQIDRTQPPSTTKFYELIKPEFDMFIQSFNHA